MSKRLDSKVIKFAATPKLQEIPILCNILLQGSMLYIKSVGTQDRGIFRCLADNAVRPPAVFDVNLYTTFKPVARAIQSSYGQAENRMFDVTIECRIAGMYPN